ncbi:MAG: hypothetical protein JWP11_1904 [Frankiales bacterium]|nr:hypothetical protein [Frankiales bacterium]
MAIAAADIKYRLTIKTGVAGNAAAQPDPNQSLGKYASTTDIVDATSLNLFDAISGDENAASTVDYRAFVVYNSHGTLTWQNPKVWISAEVASGASVAIGLDPIGVAAIAAILGTSIVDESAAPAGVTFSSPTTKAAGLAPASVPAGSAFIVWVRRTAANTAAVDADGATFSAQGDTAA